jgi:RHH-type proline utilization regulon transcriptional repressor/proline dehydrogenase/delta 1-pyrroline-5-carboxylate dehydrogenase
VAVPPGPRVQTGLVSDASAATPAALAPAAVVLARRWARGTAAGGSVAERRAADRLHRLLAEPAGLELAVRFVDRVARPEDVAVAARELAALPSGAAFLDPADRLLLALGRRLAPLLPGVVVPLARARLRALVGHLVLDAADLDGHLAAAGRDGLRLNLNVLGEAVLGEAEARRRADRTLALVERGDVPFVSVKVSALVPQIAPWDTAGSVERVAERLRPLYQAAARRDPPTVVTLDMEEYRDLDLTLGVVTAVLDEPELLRLEAGVALQAYLPDALRAFELLLAFARRRRERGGGRLRVRLVKGANLAVERVEAELHGWWPAPFATKSETDASFVRLLDVALRPDVTESVQVAAASHNLYDLALAHLLARARGVAEALDVEMLRGMAPAQARAVLADAGSVVLYTPVVDRADLPSAVAYLVRRLEESAAGGNFLHALATWDGPGLPPGQEEAFLRSVADLARVTAEPRRGPRPQPATGFANAPDADPARAGDRARALAALAAPPREPRSGWLADVRDVDDVVARARVAGRAWRAWPAAARAAALRAAAERLAAGRADLLTVMAHEAGKTLAEADPEVSEAVDFARYYAERALALEEVDGARFEPVRLTVVTPPWNFPVAIPIGSTLAALAAGSAVVLKPAPATPVCAEVAGDAVRAALVAAGAPADVLLVVRAAEDDVGRRLVSHPGVEAVVLTGSRDTARLFASWRPDLRLVAETSGKNAIVVTPSADVDLAVADVVRSAFGHAGQKCSAASLVIAVGSVATSPRFRRQLVDAVSSLRVAWAEDPGAGMGPLIDVPTGKLERALTRLDPGESWLVAPRRLDASGRLWSPGLKEGVRPGSFFHLTECFGPVLGVMAASTLDEAVDLQNGTAFGLTGGLHSLDDGEVARWLERVEVGNAYVNRHITGAIVRRQPFGGWKASSVGPGAKAGGPNYVAQLGVWYPNGEPRAGAPLPRRVERLLETLLPLLDGPQASTDARWLRRASASDAHAWTADLGREVDVSGLASESDVLRYRPLPGLTIRLGAGGRWADVVRLLLAAELAGTPARVSAHPGAAADLPAVADGAGLAARAELARRGLRVETAEDLAGLFGRAGEPARVRVVGDVEGGLAAAAAAAGTVLLPGPVLAAGRRELLTVLREQSVSRSLHRYGHVPPGRRPPPP